MPVYDKYAQELINEGAKLKTWDAPNNPGCKYCQDAVLLVIGETNDYGIVISAAGAYETATIMAYGYDVHGSGSNGLSAKINFCPMCGKKLYQEKRREVNWLMVADEKMNKPTVKIKLLPGGKMPERMSKCAAAWDCFAREDVLVGEEPMIIGLGFMAEPPDGYYLKILPRSSIGANTPLRMPNKQDIIDGDYRGEVNAVYECKLHTTTYEGYGTRLKFGPYEIKAGDRIAQMLLCKMEDADLVEVDELSETERGAKGFGSTGMR